MYDKTAVIKTKKLNFFCFYLLSLCDDDNEAVKGISWRTETWELYWQS